MKIHEELGTIFQDEDFKDLFPRKGQPAESPFRLALVTILQFLEGLSDRAAADAVRGRIDWKYLLCLDLEDAGFDYSVLSEFRARLLEGGAEQRLLDKLLERLRERKLLGARTLQRTDSTHVIAAVREMSRLECILETLRAALNVLSTVVPDWVRSRLPMEWVERYQRRAEEYRLPEEDQERVVLAEQIGADGDRLLKAIWSEAAPSWLRNVPIVEILRQVWVQNFIEQNNTIQWRQVGNLPPASLYIRSPYDPAAQFAKKRSTTWLGYKVHLTETCDPNLPHLITNVHSGAALTGDNDALAKIHEELRDRELLPKTHLVDSGYVEAKRIVESEQEYGVDLWGPTPGNHQWQFEQSKGFHAANFPIDWERKQATCPEGKVSSSWRPQRDARGNEVINVMFAKADCSRCPSLTSCTNAASKRRTLTIKPQPLYAALEKARQREQTEEFQKRYRKRSGIEGTLSQGVRAFQLRGSRYIGLAKTHLQHIATVTAINLQRMADWWDGVVPAVTRQSAFARTMLAVPT
jgi:transposase